MEGSASGGHSAAVQRVFRSVVDVDIVARRARTLAEPARGSNAGDIGVRRGRGGCFSPTRGGFRGSPPYRVCVLALAVRDRRLDPRGLVRRTRATDGAVRTAGAARHLDPRARGAAASAPGTGLTDRPLSGTPPRLSRLPRQRHSLRLVRRHPNRERSASTPKAAHSHVVCVIRQLFG